MLAFSFSLFTIVLLVSLLTSITYSLKASTSLFVSYCNSALLPVMRSISSENLRLPISLPPTDIVIDIHNYIRSLLNNILRPIL